MSQAFFVHVPKTAGTSIRTLIAANYEPHTVLSLYGARGEIFESCRQYIGKTSEFELVQGHTPYGTHRYLGVSAPRYFSFLREPIARTLSDIAHSRRHASHGFHHILSAPDLTLTEQVEKAKELTYYRNNMTHFLSGTFFTKDISLLEFNLAVDNLWQSEFVGITEYSEESFLIMGRQLGWKYFIPQKCNVAPNKERTIDPGISKLCESFLGYDIQLYLVALDHFHQTLRRYGNQVSEAAQQMREILNEQANEYPDVAFNQYQVGAPLQVPISAYLDQLPKGSPLARWIAESGK